MPDLNVSKKTVFEFLDGMGHRKFVIPDYQRPYKWDIEKCETLWLDILSFLEENPTDELNPQDDSNYFLGTIVSYAIEDGNFEIIDGQQRITTLFLLLRAYYAKLEKMDVNDPNVRGLKNQISSCIWQVNRISMEIVNKENYHLESRVATKAERDILHNLICTGIPSSSAKDRYSNNFKFFAEKIDTFARDNPFQWEMLCISIMRRCILLPIQCDTSETALTIFSTLNDRGMPLEDSDIFKAKLYGSKQSDEEKDLFNEAWKELIDICKRASIRIDDLFRYYTHVLRGRNGDTSREVALRKFYANGTSYDTLLNVDFEEILDLSKFWEVLNNRAFENNQFAISLDAFHYIHCLSTYPNDFWKYIVSAFFIKNRSSLDFANNFSIFLKKTTAFLLAKFVARPSVNSIKDDIYAACSKIFSEGNVEFTQPFDTLQIRERFPYLSSKITRTVLLLSAYQHPGQLNLLPSNFDIEHIFPRKWQDTNYFGWDKNEASVSLEKLGNKIVLEKKLNIQAGNGYFGQKKQKYMSSSIKVVQDLGALQYNDWVQVDIEEREKNLTEQMIDFFQANLVAIA